ncbi:P-loop containing nucleoside triphosphate hydrolase protein [Pelagophyceae sp. CCMP2097]|nr:P-loop containing nucleoside triphosphate hydrolase protein [Pelagophyceae sp. CCMP2097]
MDAAVGVDKRARAGAGGDARPAKKAFLARRASTCQFCGVEIAVDAAIAPCETGAWVHAACAAESQAAAAKLQQTDAPTHKLTADQNLVAKWQPASWAAAARGKRVRVVAHAGTGKTTALRALAGALLSAPDQREAPWLKMLYLTFNRAAADDAKRRFASLRGSNCGVDARTFHSALLSCARAKGAFDCPPRLPQSMDDVATLCGGLESVAQQRIESKRLPQSKLVAEQRALGKEVWRTVQRFCQAADIKVERKHLPQDTERKDAADCAAHGWRPLHCVLVPWARTIFRKAADLEDASVALTQTIMAKVVHLRMVEDAATVLKWGGAGAPHVIFVDEAQDLDACQLAVLELQRQRGPSTVVMVGDPMQAIYEFRGASPDALRDSITSGRADEEFHLRNSFRFGPAIAHEANRMLFVKQRYDRAFKFQPVQGLGAQGIVSAWKPDEPLEVQPPFAFICRTNKGILTSAAHLLKIKPPIPGEATQHGFEESTLLFEFAGETGIAAYVDIIDAVLDLFSGNPTAHKVVGRWATFADLTRALEDDSEDDDVDASVKSAVDLVLTWKAQLRVVTRNVRSASRRHDDAALQGSLLNAQKRHKVTFTTAHRAKGLEFDRVVVGDDFAALVDERTGAAVTKLHHEELHAWHVALTRAKHELYLPPKYERLRKLHADDEARIPGPGPLAAAPGGAFLAPEAAAGRPPARAAAGAISMSAMMNARQAPKAPPRTGTNKW